LLLLLDPKREIPRVKENMLLVAFLHADYKYINKDIFNDEKVHDSMEEYNV